jgi:DNA-directed RNA polymerase subunit beta'
MNSNDFSAIKIGLASPEKIRSWSYGEVKKPETINYRSQKPEKDGLFCERIFGPSKDWECACGKYKKVRYKGIICDRCGVEVTKSSVRRERMGHIKLAAPVAHIWFLRGIPSRMSILLNLPPKQLESIVYFVSWIVTDPKDSDLDYKQILSESEYRRQVEINGYGSFEAQTGAEAVLTLLSKFNIDEEYKLLTEELVGTTGDRRRRLLRRYETVVSFLQSDNQPEWMVLQSIPVIPPDLRPMLQLDGGRFAASDLNDLYRRVITRNNRLRRLLDLGTPAIIVQNEKRMLQEAVDALIDNGRRSKPVTGAGGRALKSLSHSLKGKQGRFRQNLLGKRVDFSGRSVIAVGPTLKMDECGLPKEMAIQLFKPFVVNELKVQGIVSNGKQAEKLIEQQDSRVWDVLEEVIENHPVLLNRAPTLHRLGIQAFKPVLVDGRAIRLHPLVTPAFNADFDGDQMAVHVPLSEEAQAEAEILMLGSNNILGPKDGKPIVTPSQDMVLGNYYLNMEATKQEFHDKADRLESEGHSPEEVDRWRNYGNREGSVYSSPAQAILAYENKLIHLHTRIALRASSFKKAKLPEHQMDNYIVTTVGKLIFNEALPVDFPYINEITLENFTDVSDRYFFEPGTNPKEFIETLQISNDFKKKDLGILIKEIFDRFEEDKNRRTSAVLDKIKDLGFRYSTVAGTTVSLNDIVVAPNKDKYVDYGKEKAVELKALLNRGLLTPQEWESKLMLLWDSIKSDIGNELMDSMTRMNPINMMATSGARGNVSNFTQLSGIRGLMGKPTQSKSRTEYVPSIIEVPIYSNFREGLNVSEFFLSTHGVRKGLTDTALKTAESGYLTRRLVDVAQDVVIEEDDCGTETGYKVSAIVDRKSGQVIESLIDRIVGRFSQNDVIDPKTKEVLVEADGFITEVIASKIVAAEVEEVEIRSAFTCESQYGVCKKCYGRNMATGKIVEIGEAVGIMAAQSIGEPGTQLTMRTFHTGGVAGSGSDDITQGLPRVEELFEARSNLKHKAVISKIDGKISAIEPNDKGIMSVHVTNKIETIEHPLPVNTGLRSYLSVGTDVRAGDKLTDGPVDPKELLEDTNDVKMVQSYILKEVKKVYDSQGIEISDKHIEVMIRQMLRRVVIVDPGDTHLSAGMHISLPRIQEINEKMLLSGKLPAQYRAILLGISKASVETDSFLSAASFQETTKVLTEASLRGKVDSLLGLKENVIVGKMIPAGTGANVERESTNEVLARAAELKLAREERNKQEEEFATLPEEMLRVSE